MKKLNKIVTLTLTAALLVSALTVPASAATITTQEFDADGNVVREWSIDTETGTATLVETPTAEAGAYFADVPDSDPNAQAINALAKAGILDGLADGNGNFRPNDTVTYGEFVTIIARICGMDGLTGLSGTGIGSRNVYGTNRIIWLEPDDVPHWAAWYLYGVAACVYNDDTLVNYEDLDCNVVRGSALSVIYRTMVHVGTVTTPVNNYTRDDIPDWDAVLGVEYSKVPGHVYFIGDKLNFLPDKYVSQRDQEMTPGYDMENVKLCNPDMKPYVITAPYDVLAMYNLGITTGVDEAHTCNPLGTLTRAELCVLLQRAGLDHVFPHTYRKHVGKEI